MKKYILALDQGTTSSRAILFDKNCVIRGIEQKEIKQIYPRPGWVEHNPMEILETQIYVANKVMENNNIKPEEIASIGITNQRETSVVWDKNTGKPIYNAVVWQCRRSVEKCEELRAKGFEGYIKENTGLVVDAYFSGTKISWILENVEGAYSKAKKGELLFGTIDTWIIWNITKGKLHITDYTNASRTMIYNIKKLQWDDVLLRELQIPRSMLPQVKSSSETYGLSHKDIFGSEILISAIAGDQQSALFGQGCFKNGMAKNTYGTGCFMLLNTGDKLVESEKGLITTLACNIGNDTEYALEGSVFVGGAVIQWLRDELGIIKESSESEKYALEVQDANGVYLVPAFVGLGAPHWDMYARGSMFGITRGVNKNHIIRAALESIAYQTKDIIDSIEKDTGIELKTLRVDGGASNNNFLMQFQSDILEVPVERPLVTETTALGVAFLSGIAIGIWENKDEIYDLIKIEKTFTPKMSKITRNSIYNGWKKAVSRSMNWEEN